MQLRKCWSSWDIKCLSLSPLNRPSKPKKRCSHVFKTWHSLINHSRACFCSTQTPVKKPGEGRKVTFFEPGSVEDTTASEWHQMFLSCSWTAEVICVVFIFRKTGTLAVKVLRKRRPVYLTWATSSCLQVSCPWFQRWLRPSGCAKDPSPRTTAELSSTLARWRSPPWSPTSYSTQGHPWLLRVC